MHIKKQTAFLFAITALILLSGACGGTAEVQRHPPKNPNFQLELIIATSLAPSDSSYNPDDPSIYVRENLNPLTGQTFNVVYRLTNSKLTFGQHDITDVRIVKDEASGASIYDIMVTLGEDAEKRLARFTGENITKTSLILVNKKFVCAPTIMEKIETGTLWLGYRAKQETLREILQKDYQVSAIPELFSQK